MPGRPPRKSAPKPRRLPRNELATGAVEAMVTAAEALLARGEALTTNRIAELAGVSIGTLYQYFPNREAIVAALFDRYLGQYARVVASTIAAHAGAPLDAVCHALADAIADVYAQQARSHAALWKLRGAADVDARIDAQIDRWVAIGAAMLAPKLDPARVANVAFVIVHAADGAANAIAKRPGTVDVRAVAHELADLFVAYLRELSVVPRAEPP